MKTLSRLSKKLIFSFNSSKREVKGVKNYLKTQSIEEKKDGLDLLDEN